MNKNSFLSLKKQSFKLSNIKKLNKNFITNFFYKINIYLFLLNNI